MEKSEEKYLVSKLPEKLFNRPKIEYLITGFKYLDEEFNGLEPGLYTIGAASNMGKTTFALQLAAQMAELNDKPALYFSCEQDSIDLLAKVAANLQYRMNPSSQYLSNEKEIKNKYKWAELSRENPEKFKLINETLDQIKKWPLKLSIYDEQVKIIKAHKEKNNFGVEVWIPEREELEPITLDLIRKKIRENIDPKNGGIVVIDYLQYLTNSIASPDKQALIMQFLKRLKAISKRFNLVMFLISSLSNEKINSKKPSLINDGFKGSGDIKYTSDNTFILGPRGNSLEEWENAKKQNLSKIGLTLTCTKSRSGCWGAFDFDFYGSHAYFENIPTTEQETDISQGNNFLDSDGFIK